MNPLSIETIMAVLILAYISMGAVFTFKQKKGASFVASFDAAFMWGICLFISVYCMDTVAYAVGI